MIQPPASGAAIDGKLDSVPQTPRSRATSPSSGIASSASAQPTANTPPKPSPNKPAYTKISCGEGTSAKPSAASVIGTPDSATTSLRSKRSDSFPASTLDTIAPTSADPATSPVFSDASRASRAPSTSLKK